mmetsp:Transcript_92041/g.168848  ORF Transcript_92041/g.168848 Transcript_92041/m.168848 type:complete len:265 (+) Transcript_92041:96-890(+)
MPRPKPKTKPEDQEEKSATAIVEAPQPGSSTMALVPTEALLAGEKKTAAQVLKEHGFWVGWANTHSVIPLGPGKTLKLPPKESPDPEIVGFAMPMAPVEYALRNERRYPPPSEEDMYREMFKHFHHTIRQGLFKRSYTLSVIYHHINRNGRDSPGWQRGLIKAKGVQCLVEYWKNPESEKSDGRSLGDKYWVLAIFGRMMGTNAESRAHLIEKGVTEIILEGTRNKDDVVRDCAVCALKGLIQFPEGRQMVTYDKLIECLAPAR